MTFSSTRHAGEEARGLEGAADAARAPPGGRAGRSGRGPRTTMRPETGGRLPATRLKRVVLPAPLGPMMAFTIPGRQEKLTSSMTCRPPNQWWRPLHLQERARSSALPAAVRRPHEPEEPVRREEHDRHEDGAEDRVVVEPEYAAQREEGEHRGHDHACPTGCPCRRRPRGPRSGRTSSPRPRPGRCRRCSARGTLRPPPAYTALRTKTASLYRRHVDAHGRGRLLVAVDGAQRPPHARADEVDREEEPERDQGPGDVVVLHAQGALPA